ncbi:MAG: hypothetical protein LBU36_01445 [Clostridiales bacterium]|nr:hypothetical protein [Clostridiales bacterium]
MKKAESENETRGKQVAFWRGRHGRPVLNPETRLGFARARTFAAAFSRSENSGSKKVAFSGGFKPEKTPSKKGAFSSGFKLEKTPSKKGAFSAGISAEKTPSKCGEAEGVFSVRAGTNVCDSFFAKRK